jgi:uncharacterized protein YjbI with pentapeptide repeats
MSNSKDITRLKRGVVAWNQWRLANPGTIPDLEDSDLGDMDLYEANLRNANLQRANLTSVKNLLNAHIGGANLAGAALPDSWGVADGVAHVQNAIRYSERTFLILLLGCVYTWLTIATTSDSNLITNSDASVLPIVHTKIQIDGFYFVAPIILICVYGYLHIQLQRLWERLSALPAVFPDGQAIDRKIVPWFVTALLYRSFIHLKTNPPSLSRVQTYISFILVWLLLPAFTLPLFWIKYIPQHFWPLTAVHVFLISISAGFGAYSYQLASDTLIGTSRFSRPYFRPALAALSFGIVFTILSYGAFRAVHQHFTIGLERQPGDISSSNIPNQFPSTSRFQNFIIGTFAFFGYSPFPRLVDEEVSAKPPQWDGNKMGTVSGARLKKRFLRHANAAGAFLVNADLEEADLERANLFRADLRASKLKLTKLFGAYLIQSDLREAEVISADIRNAYLLEANLQRANLVGVFAENARLNGAKLQNSSLRYVNFQCADFRPANMFWAELYDYRWGSSQGKISSILLEGANFENADLEGSRFEGAKLAQAIGLTQQQINGACVNDRTSLPNGLNRPKQCPKATRFVPEAQKATPHSVLTIGSLQQQIIEFVEVFRRFLSAVNKQNEELSDERRRTLSAPIPDTEKEILRRKYEQRSSELTKQQMARYDHQYKQPAIVLRKEALSRLTTEERKGSDPALYALPLNSDGMKAVADNLTHLAEKLCPSDTYIPSGDRNWHTP